MMVELMQPSPSDVIVDSSAGYAGFSTGIMIFTKKGAGGTYKAWFYDMQADGLSIDDKLQPVTHNDIPDIISCIIVEWKLN